MQATSFRPWVQAFPVAFEGAGFAIPVTIGATGLLFARISPSFVLPGVVAALCALVIMHLVAAANDRPMVYATRLLEAATLVGFLEHFVLKMPGWGLQDTPEHRLLLVLLTGIGAALLLPLCYLFRLQHFARMIPAPVFAGFNTAVALVLLISQARVLWSSVSTDGAWVSIVALSATGVALLARRWRPGWPPGVTSLLVAALLAGLLSNGGVHAFATVLPQGATLTLPIMLVQWDALAGPGIATLSIAKDLMLASATMALLVFINTQVAEETISQVKAGQTPGRADWVRACGAQMAAVLIGSPPLAPSVTASRAALLAGPLDGRSMALAAILMLLIFSSGLLSLVPMPGVAGLLLYEAWAVYDRPSLKLLATWLRGTVALSQTQREDLITVACVVASSVLFNMVAGVFVGVVAGLALYAWRNGKRIVRVIQTGAGVHSNCTRSRADMRLLAHGAERIRYVELEGALFFGATEALQNLLRSQFGPGRYLVVDWSHVISADSTVARGFIAVLREAPAAGTRVVASGLGTVAADVPELVQLIASAGQVFPDADRALEWAENEIILQPQHAQSFESTSIIDAQSWLQGVRDDARLALEAALEMRFYRAGEIVFLAGDSASELMILVQGSVDIFLRNQAGREIRVSRFRSGATMGELGFLDESTRSATAVAAEDLLLGVLSRARFDEVAQQWPQAGHQVLINLALDMAIRLRRTNFIAVSYVR